MARIDDRTYDLEEEITESGEDEEVSDLLGRRLIASNLILNVGIQPERYSGEYVSVGSTSSGSTAIPTTSSPILQYDDATIHNDLRYPDTICADCGTLNSRIADGSIECGFCGEFKTISEHDVTYYEDAVREHLHSRLTVDMLHIIFTRIQFSGDDLRDWKLQLPVEDDRLMFINRRDNRRMEYAMPLDMRSKEDKKPKQLNLFD